MLARYGFASSRGVMDRKTRLGEQRICPVAHPSGASRRLLEPLLGLGKAFGQPIVCPLLLLSPHLVHHSCLGGSNLTLFQSFRLFIFVLLPWMKIVGQGKRCLQDPVSYREGSCLLGATVMIAFCLVVGFLKFFFLTLYFKSTTRDPGGYNFLFD